VTDHIDLVENHWATAYQEQVARVVLDSEHLQVEGTPHWQERVLRVLASAGVADGSEPALRALAEHFKSDYVFATALHTEDECPFVEAKRIPSESAELLSSPSRRPRRL
jgi:hypothetical protein